MTLAISYLGQVVSATSQKRATALHIAGPGETPARIVEAGLGQSSLGTVGSQITSLTCDLALIGRQHLALPVLHNLHVGERRAAIELSVARPDEALTIVEHALREDHSQVTGPARLAITEYLRTARLPAADGPAPPPPEPAPLRGRGVELADEPSFQRAVDSIARRRAALHVLVAENGWRWEDGSA